MKKFTLIVVLVFIISAFSVAIQNENKNNNAAFLRSSDIQQQSPFAYLPTSTTHQIIKHTYYALSYNENYEQAEWVSYFLRSSDEGIGHFKRPRFIDDPKVSSESAASDNYKKSGYDRGHLCAAADMRFSKAAFDETFFTSNISPQKHNFHDGISHGNVSLSLFGG